jgi:hypothetical protein
VTSLNPSDGQLSLADALAWYGNLPSWENSWTSAFDHSKPSKSDRSFSENVSRLNTSPETADEATERAGEHADQNWVMAALSIVHELYKVRTRFNSDDVWKSLKHFDASTKEPRALGAILSKAASTGWCKNTFQFTKSQRPECHRRPIPIWQSLLFQ